MRPSRTLKVKVCFSSTEVAAHASLVLQNQHETSGEQANEEQQLDTQLNTPNTLLLRQGSSSHGRWCQRAKIIIINTPVATAATAAMSHLGIVNGTFILLRTLSSTGLK
jgi:hypothetical protein